MIVVLTVIVALLAIVVIAQQREVSALQETCQKLSKIAESDKTLFEYHHKKIKKLELAQQEQLERIISLTATTTQEHNNLKHWAYRSVGDIWYALENPLTGKEEEPEEVRS